MDDYHNFFADHLYDPYSHDGNEFSIDNEQGHIELAIWHIIILDFFQSLQHLQTYSSTPPHSILMPSD